MSHRVLAPFIVALLIVCGLLATPAMAQNGARTCPTKDGSYKVTAPASRADNGGDPAEDAAVNCTLGYHEKKEYPLSLIGVALVMTAFGLVVMITRRKDFDALGSDA